MSPPPTIFALSSGAARAGVAVVRLSGPAAPLALEALAGVLPEPRRAGLRTLRSPATGEPIDRSLVLHFPEPNSYTGEDVVELHIHGGRAVIAAVLDALSRQPGLRLAEPGEFTRRAFANGRLDLTEVEGLADLIAAETEEQRRQALAQCAGRQRDQLEAWRGALIGALARVEAAIDFADEADVPAEAFAQALPVAAGLARDIRRHLADGRRGEILREGFRVVLAGAPNAGKSSLLNALANRDVAIVSPEPGTTRDTIEVHLDLDGLPVIVTDTAGIREAGGSIEREGIRRALARAAEADLVLWLTDGSDGGRSPPPSLGPAEVVHTKADQAGLAAPPGALAISSVTGSGLDLLTARIADRARRVLAPGEPALVTRARHREQLETCAAALERFGAGPADELELRAEDLRQAAQALGRLSGRVDVEDLLDEIFASFCIGK